MKNLKTFEAYSSYRAPKEIAFLKEPVEIRIDVAKVVHASDRQIRHGIDNAKITDDDIIDTVELSIEELFENNTSKSYLPLCFCTIRSTLWQKIGKQDSSLKIGHRIVIFFIKKLSPK